MKIGVIHPGPENMRCPYRVWPLASLPGAQLLSFAGWGAYELMQCDLLFIHRPWHAMHRNIIGMARSLGIGVWLDFDDRTLHIPFWLQAAQQHGGPYR